MDTPYTEDPLLDVNWHKTGRYPTSTHNIQSDQSGLILLIDRLRSLKKAPMLAALHTANLFLQAAWRTYEDKVRNGDQTALDYQAGGEYYLKKREDRGTAVYLNSQEDERYLAYCSAENILQSWTVLGGHNSGQTQTSNGPDAGLVIALHNTNHAIVNHWGPVEIAEKVGLILTKREGGSYAFVPWRGYDYPDPMSLQYMDVAGNLCTGHLWVIGQVQHDKIYEYRGVDDSNRFLVSGLPLDPKSTIPTAEQIAARLRVHPKVTLNVFVRKIEPM